MELRHLRYFIRAAELLHFTRAAESLYISQPTLSVHIQQLEEELGVALFARVGRRVRLTEAGKLLLIRANQAVNELETAAHEIGALTGCLSGTLCVSALPAHGTKLLPGWIDTFSLRHPDVHIKARSGSSEDIETGIVAGLIDIGISVLPVDHDEIKTAELFSDDLLVIVSTQHPLADKKKLEVNDLHMLPIALPSHRVVWTRQLATFFDQQKVRPKIVVELDDGNALLEIVKKGNLATFLPQGAVIDYPYIRYWPLPGPGLRTTTAALWTHLSPAAKAFLDIATSGAKEQRSHRSKGNLPVK